MAIIDPRRKTSPFSDDTPQMAPSLPAVTVRPTAAQRFLNSPMPGAPAPGSAMAKADAYGLQHPSNFMGFPLNNPPVPLQSGEAAPDVNPQAAGTRFGSTLRAAGADLNSAATSSANRALRVGTSIGNAISRPLRAATAFGVDALRAATGDAPRADAGKTYAAAVAPQLTMPNRPAPVNFVAGAASARRPPSPADPATSGASGGAPTPAPVDNISAGNLATALRFPTKPIAAPATPPVSSAAPAVTGATVVDANGKPNQLTYGANVGGVPTFSDGTGGIPQTMSPEAMKQLAQERSISRADPGALGHALASDALGHTASTGEMVAQNVARAQLTRPITGSRPSAEQFAAADRNAIALRDPRSAAGTAAHNLAIEAQYGSGRAARRAAADSLTQLTAGADRAGLQAQQTEGQQGITDQQGQNALDQTALQGENTLANTALEGQNQLRLPRAGQQVTLADGTIGLQDPITGAITPSKLTDGTAAKGLVTRDDPATKRTNEIVDQLNKGVQEQMKTFLPSKDVPTPTPEMISQWREQNARAIGLPLGTDPKTGRRVANINGQVVPL